MDDKSKLSSISDSVYMSANEIEMTSMKESLSDFTIKKSESVAEKIKEELEDELPGADMPLLGAKTSSPDDVSLRDYQETSFLADATELTVAQQLEQEEQDALLAVNLQNESQLPETRPTNIFNLINRLKENSLYIIFGFVLLLFIALLLIVLPKCFFGLYYNEVCCISFIKIYFLAYHLNFIFFKYALVRSKLTGKVDDSHVYEPGWHFLSPFSQWIKFYKSAHNIKLKNLRIFTKDQLRVQVSFVIYYFLK